jgi:glucose-1-phosphate cytidylyltransferase
MKYYSEFGFNEFVICCGYKGYLIKEYFADYYLHRSDVTFDFSNGNAMTVHSNVAEPWKVTVVDTGQHTQTGGRIRRVHPYVKDEPFFMTYGDGVSNVDLNALLQKHEKSGKTVTVTAIQPGGRFGVMKLRGDNVTGFQEKAQGDGGWINAGFMVMAPGIFDYLDGDGCVLEHEPLERLSAGGKLGAYKHCGFWQCMDTQRDMMALESLWNSGRAQWKVWK